MKLNEFKLCSFVFTILPLIFSDLLKLEKLLASPMNKKNNPKIINKPKTIAIIFISLILELRLD